MYKLFFDSREITAVLLAASKNLNVGMYWDIYEPILFKHGMEFGMLLRHARVVNLYLISRVRTVHVYVTSSEKNAVVMMWFGHLLTDYFQIMVKW